MNRIVKIIGVLIVISLLVFWGFRKSPEDRNKLQEITSEIDLLENKSIGQINEYAIQKLREKEFTKGEIVVENTVSTSDVNIQKVTYKVDGLKEYALMITPTSTPSESGFPVIVVNHGYIDPEIYSTENNYINTSTYYARQGFLVLKPDYRGHDASDGSSDGFTARINYATDVLQLLHSLESIENADTNNIFMYGHSMGADVTLRVLETSDIVNGATLWAPAVTDFPESFLYFVRKNRQNELERRKKEIEQSLDPVDYDLVSVTHNLSFINVPLLVHHGTDDESVPYKWGESLVSKLKSEGKNVEFFTYQGDNHDISRNFSRALSKDVSFFNSLIQK